VTCPSLFVAHGSPLLVDDAVWMAELARWAGDMPRPESILVLSAHWVDDVEGTVTIGATKTTPVIHDFYNLPRRYYELAYGAPGAPDLAERVRGLLGARHRNVKDAPDRGLDHGAYVPLLAMYPAADIPVLQVSIPTMDPASLIELGQALAPLRDEGTLIMGAGFLTHNLATLPRDARGKIDVAELERPAPPWAIDMDAWCADVLGARDADALAAYRRQAPSVETAHPTHEHFVPICVALGASLGRDEATRFPITGFTYGSFTKRSVQFG